MTARTTGATEGRAVWLWFVLYVCVLSVALASDDRVQLGAVTVTAPESLIALDGGCADGTPDDVLRCVNDRSNGVALLWESAIYSSDRDPVSVRVGTAPFGSNTDNGINCSYAGPLSWPAHGAAAWRSMTDCNGDGLHRHGDFMTDAKCADGRSMWAAVVRFDEPCAWQSEGEGAVYVSLVRPVRALEVTLRSSGDEECTATPSVARVERVWSSPDVSDLAVDAGFSVRARETGDERGGWLWKFFDPEGMPVSAWAVSRADDGSTTAVVPARDGDLAVAVRASSCADGPSDDCCVTARTTEENNQIQVARVPISVRSYAVGGYNVSVYRSFSDPKVTSLYCDGWVGSAPRTLAVSIALSPGVQGAAAVRMSGFVSVYSADGGRDRRRLAFDGCIGCEGKETDGTHQHMYALSTDVRKGSVVYVHIVVNTTHAGGSDVATLTIKKPVGRTAKETERMRSRSSEDPAAVSRGDGDDFLHSDPENVELSDTVVTIMIVCGFVGLFLIAAVLIEVVYRSRRSYSFLHRTWWV